MPAYPQPVPTSTSSPPALRVEDLHKSFNDKPVLTGVSFQLLRGEILAIVGGSGCGKTVLLNHIIGHLKPDSGRILVADHSQQDAPLVDINAIDEDHLDRLRTHWAVVFQRNALFSGSVYDNIALWLREHLQMPEPRIRERARAALDAVGFKGDDSILKKDRDELSGGMAKRVAVARALAMDPVMLFYDEPTAGLDPAHAKQIHKLICDTHAAPRTDDKTQTTLIITHDKDLLRRLSPRILMLHEGRVYFDGSYEHFEESDSPIIRPYFELMAALNLREPAH
ncbi:MAG: ABC transporter ATP-binding protein [Phycisphaerales bacterium]